MASHKKHRSEKAAWAQKQGMQHAHHPNQGRGHAYGNRMGMVGPIPRTSGLDTAGAMQWAKDHKWYLLGGALLLGAAIAFAKR